MRHAFLIIAHNGFEQLKYLLETMDDSRADIYVHLDKKWKDADERKLYAACCHSEVVLIKRTHTPWGSYRLAECMLSLMEEALQHGQYGYFHLLSGHDFPVMGKEAFYAFFEQNPKEEWVHFQAPDVPERILTRVRYFHFFRACYGNALLHAFGKALLLVQKALHVNRLSKRKTPIQYGSQWFSVTGAFAAHAVSKKAEIRKMFRYSDCSDELVIQTVLLNSPFLENRIPGYGSDALLAGRYIDWNRGNPYVFRAEDYSNIVNSGAFFARKIDGDHKLLPLLRKHYLSEVGK